MPINRRDLASLGRYQRGHEGLIGPDALAGREPLLAMQYRAVDQAPQSRRPVERAQVFYAQHAVEIAYPQHGVLGFIVRIRISRRRRTQHGGAGDQRP